MILEDNPQPAHTILCLQSFYILATLHLVLINSKREISSRYHISSQYEFIDSETCPNYMKMNEPDISLDEESLRNLVINIVMEGNVDDDIKNDIEDIEEQTVITIKNDHVEIKSYPGLFAVLRRYVYEPLLNWQAFS